MRRIEDVLNEINPLSDQQVLEDFIARGWVRPVRDEIDYVFDEIDISRIYLICELRIDMKFEIDAIDIILSLIDQLQEKKLYLNKVIDAIKEQPKEIQHKIVKSCNNVQ